MPSHDFSFNLVLLNRSLKPLESSIKIIYPHHTVCPLMYHNMTLNQIACALLSVPIKLKMYVRVLPYNLIGPCVVQHRGIWLVSLVH